MERQGRNRRFDRILIVKPSAMGDVVMASMLIPAIKSAFPFARISWLVDPPYASLLTPNPRIHEVIPWSKGEWKRRVKHGKLARLVRDVILFGKDLRGRGFDLAIDAQGLTRSRFLAWLSGANVRVGISSHEPGDFFMTHIVPLDRSDTRIGSEYREILACLGIPSKNPRMDLHVDSQAEVRTKELLARHNASDRFAVLAPFTTRPQKHWIASRWVEVTRVLEAWGFGSVILGGPGDREEGERIRLEAGGRVLNLAGKVRLAESVAIVAKSTLVIGVDTGLTHMGTALERPTVAIFGSTCPYLDPGTRQTTVLTARLPCSPCRRRPTCNGSYPCMEAVTVSHVMSAAQALLFR